MLVKVRIYSSEAHYTRVHDFATQIRGFAFSPGNLTLMNGYMHQAVHNSAPVPEFHQYPDCDSG